MINYSKDEHNIVTLSIDMPGLSVNIMNAAFRDALASAVARLEEEKEQLSGVILTSGKDSFFAGGDLRELISIQDAKSCLDMVEKNKAVLRRLEKLSKPVVAAINGSAIGGGLELALACHYRIALDNPKAKIGFPEVTLGLLPGAGGVVRSVRLLGLQEVMPYLLEGKQVSPAAAVKAGLVHALASSHEGMLQQATTWILANPHAQQPWDDAAYKLPGGAANSAKLLPMIMVAPAMLREKTRGNYPAPEAILAAMVEGAQVDFDNALKIEGRYFTHLATGQVAKNMIGTLFFQMQEISSGKSRPQHIPKSNVSELGIIGAGMMGAGIAAVSAARGITTILKEHTLEKAEQGKTNIANNLHKKVAQGRLPAETAARQLELILPTAHTSDFSGCDLIIEAVFENRELKATVSSEAESMLAADGIMASNTSTLPISGLAKAINHPERFIGIHFFSPVDKMQLVEIIKGKLTNEVTLARAYDYVLQIGKTPIVVNDSRGFFTSRVFASFVNEGLSMLAEGLPAALIENAALSVGMPVGPLAVQDEVSLSLSRHVAAQTKADLEAEGKSWQAPASAAIINAMLDEHQRAGKAAGAGFYEYPADGGKKYLWPELPKLFEKVGYRLPYADLQDRFLYIQSIETLRCMAEGVLESSRDANIGSIFGIGFPAWTGGAVQFINHVGAERFAVRAARLQAQFGERFALPENYLALTQPRAND
ncbi:3-hydroxyacyl-CoA dehydrogenase NAD-binding domain-containing protein [Undibacterium sp.]|uniref:3-hydroxyacyl-CoA dehydrogenase NAD-binding domain-containing protein n=1 Tax=Undibacterium sp. TaxID=1914977 RepID=UPI0027312888|nr:3-hydroxyacyl-CoA dehydrogenase NAD-binding domain-containing protein [Undibacterium sp.]MDP1979677.1 3-hydroxyacyl-CoA dehydrogenase NAD-binding domain-containing protein [Undibacterium sp.]